MTTWITQAISWTEDHAAAVQALSAVVVAILTVFLVAFTRRYVKGTEEALTISRDQLQLLREQVNDQKRALQLSKEQREHDALENHREVLNTKVLEPLQHKLQCFLEPTFGIKFSMQRYRPNLSAGESPAVAGPILVMLEPELGEQDSLDTALVEDIKLHHHRLLMSEWEHFEQSWLAHRNKHRKWIEEMAAYILNESGLPPHPSKDGKHYVMDLGLSLFVYERVMLRGILSLKIDETAYSFPVLSDGGTSYAAGPIEQVRKVFGAVEALLKSQMQKASELREEWSKLEVQRRALSGSFSLAIATKTLPEKCPLVSLR